MTHHKSYGSVLASDNEDVNEVRNNIVYTFPHNNFPTAMVLRYTVCDVELPYPGKFPCPGLLQGFLHDLILGHTNPRNFSYPRIVHILQNFPFPVKASMHKSVYLFESNNI